MRMIATLLAAVRDLFGLALTLVVAALVFVLFTGAGARLVFGEVESRLGSVHAEAVSGRLWGPIRFGRLVYEDDTVRVELSEAELDWSLLQALRGRVGVQQLAASTVVVALKPRPPEPEPPEPDADGSVITALPIGVRVRDLEIGQFRLEQPEAEPLVLDAIAFEGQWIGDRVRIDRLAAVTPWVGALQLDADARMRPHGIDFDTLRLDGFAHASLQGHLGYTEASDLTLRWDRLQWPPPAAGDASDGATGETAAPPLVSSERGVLSWQGLFDDWRYRLDAAFVADGISGAVVAAGRGSLSDVEAEHLAVNSDAGTLDAQARVHWDGPLRIDAKGSVAGVHPERWLPDLPGEIAAGFEVESVVENDVPRMRFTVTSDRATLRDYPLKLDVAGSYTEDGLDLQHALLQSGSSRVRASGRAWPQLDLRARIDARDLAALWPGLGGRASGRVHLSGEPTAPVIDATLAASEARYGAFEVQRLDARADLDLDGRTHLDVRAESVRAGTEIDALTLVLDGAADDHRLSVDARGQPGQLKLRLGGALDRTQWRWTGQVEDVQAAPRDFAAWSLEAPVPLTIDADAVRLEPACLSSTVARACVALRPVDAAQRVAFRLEHFDLAALDPWMPSATHIEGRLDGFGYADLAGGALADLRLQIDSGAGRLAQKGVPPLLFGAGQVLVEDQDGTMVMAAALPLQQGGVRFNARLAPDGAVLERPLSGTLAIELPSLAWLSLLNREFEDVAGRLDGELALRGNLADPRMSGQIVVSGMALRLRTPGIRIEDLNATLTGDVDGTLKLAGAMRSDGGTVELDGALDLWSPQPTADAHLTGADFQILRTPEARIWISPDIRVSMAKREVHIDGTVDVPRARIAPRSLEGGVAPSSDQVIIRSEDEADEGRIKTYAELAIRLGDAVEFEGFGLKTRFGGGLRIFESPGVPTRGRGEIKLIGGQYKAYGQNLSIETGRLLFTGGAVTEPGLEVRATRQPTEDITVGVQVRGTLDNPEFSLFSTPPMPQERQLSWLVLGRSLDESSGSQDKALVADAALGLGLAGGEWLAQRLGKTIGFDEVSLGAKPGQSSDQASLTVGKYLSPRLFVSYGVGLFQPGHTFRLQYDIGHGFKLSSETGAVSGGDVLYTIER